MYELMHYSVHDTNNSRLLAQDRLHELNNEQAAFARPVAEKMPLLDVIRTYKPTIMIGVTARHGLFTEEIIREMHAVCEKPIIFPLSNPTAKAECTAESAYNWTNGQCIFASGSPFDKVVLDDGREMVPSQCNNMYVFPGLGLGVTLCGAQKVTDRMLYVAAEALAKFVTPEDLKNGRVFPPITRIREVSHKIAVAVIEEAIEAKLATKLGEKDVDGLDELVATKMYFPEYVPLVEKRGVTI